MQLILAYHIIYIVFVKYNIIISVPCDFKYTKKSHSTKNTDAEWATFVKHRPYNFK